MESWGRDSSPHAPLSKGHPRAVLSLCEHGQPPSLPQQEKSVVAVVHEDMIKDAFWERYPSIFSLKKR